MTRARRAGYASPGGRIRIPAAGASGKLALQESGGSGWVLKVEHRDAGKGSRKVHEAVGGARALYLVGKSVGGAKKLRNGETDEASSRQRPSPPPPLTAAPPSLRPLLAPPLPLVPADSDPFPPLLPLARLLPLRPVAHASIAAHSTSKRRVRRFSEIANRKLSARRQWASEGDEGQGRVVGGRGRGRGEVGTPMRTRSPNRGEDATRRWYGWRGVGAVAQSRRRKRDSGSSIKAKETKSTAKAKARGGDSESKDGTKTKTAHSRRWDRLERMARLQVGREGCVTSGGRLAACGNTDVSVKKTREGSNEGGRDGTARVATDKQNEFGGREAKIGKGWERMGRRQSETTYLELTCPTYNASPRARHGGGRSLKHLRYLEDPQETAIRAAFFKHASSRFAGANLTTDTFLKAESSDESGGKGGDRVSSMDAGTRRLNGIERRDSKGGGRRERIVRAGVLADACKGLEPPFHLTPSTVQRFGRLRCPFLDNSIWKRGFQRKPHLAEKPTQCSIGKPSAYHIPDHYTADGCPAEVCVADACFIFC
ncbi:hypothetical protein C8R45DRAFT_1135370 [Mycena sanguinolenta]|nr:hypothetical protein C8R45DRAFT_1135370 [Mycena sanguinolenta]